MQGIKTEKIHKRRRNIISFYKNNNELYDEKDGTLPKVRAQNNALH